MTLFELIKSVSEIITPEQNEYSNYVLYTSDDNGGFLRTRYCWWNKSFKDIKLQDEYKQVLVACNKEINVNDLVNKNDTKLKIQFHYDYLNASFKDAEWDIQMGYCYIYLFNLNTKTYSMEYRECLI